MELFGAIAIVALSFLTILYAYFKYAFDYFKSRGVPFDSPSIPYGNAKDFGKTIHSTHYMKKLYDKFKPTGAKICGVFLFSRPAVVLLDLELVKSVLVKDFVNFNDRGAYFKTIRNQYH